MTALDRSQAPAVTRRRFVALGGLAALWTLVFDASRRTEPAVAAAAPLLRPSATGTSSSRCAHCGSPAHSMLSPVCEEGAAPRRALQNEARRRSAGLGRSPR